MLQFAGLNRDVRNFKMGLHIGLGAAIFLLTNVHPEI